MKGTRRLSDFELRAELNRHYMAEHGHAPERPFWLGDAEYLAEVRAAQQRRAEGEATRLAALRAATAERVTKLREEHPPEPKLRKATGGGEQSVITMIRAHGPLSAADAAEHLGVSRGAAQVRMWRAALAGKLVIETDGRNKRYALPAGGGQ